MLAPHKLKYICDGEEWVGRLGFSGRTFLYLNMLCESSFVFFLNFSSTSYVFFLFLLWSWQLGCPGNTWLTMWIQILLYGKGMSITLDYNLERKSNWKICLQFWKNVLVQILLVFYAKNSGKIFSSGKGLMINEDIYKSECTLIYSVFSICEWWSRLFS